MQNHVTPEFLASQGLSPSFSERFWSKVNKDGPVPAHMDHLGPCWVWTGYKDKKGYGRMMKKNKGGLILAHVASWMLHHGPIPEGMLTLHACDFPSCVRESHLFIGTKRDNTMDAVAKGRWAPQFGSHNGNNKLSEQQVLEIRYAHSLGANTITKMANLYGVTPTAIWQIVHRKNWKHI